MAIQQVGAEESFDSLLLGGGRAHITCARAAPDHVEPAPQTEAIETMLDAFDRARGALENLANLVTFSVRRTGQWRYEPAVDAARECLLSSQREALQLVDQVLGDSRARRPG